MSMAATRAISTFMSKFENSVTELPLREAVRFTDKNVKWTSETFNVSYLDLALDS